MAKGGNGNVSVRNGGITDTTQAGTGRRNDRRPWDELAPQAQGSTRLL